MKIRLIAFVVLFILFAVLSFADGGPVCRPPLCAKGCPECCAPCQNPL